MRLDFEQCYRMIYTQIRAARLRFLVLLGSYMHLPRCGNLVRLLQLYKCCITDNEKPLSMCDDFDDLDLPYRHRYDHIHYRLDQIL